MEEKVTAIKVFLEFVNKWYCYGHITIHSYVFIYKKQIYDNCQKMNLPEYLGAFRHISKPKCNIFSLFWSKLIPLIAKFMEIIQNVLLTDFQNNEVKKQEVELICIHWFKYLGSLSLSQSLNVVIVFIFEYKIKSLVVAMV